MPIGIGAGTMIAGIVAGGAAATGAVLASKANTKAAKLQSATANTALTYQEQQDALNRQQYMVEYQRTLDLQNHQLAVDAARRTNVNAVLQGGANGKLSDLLGLTPIQLQSVAPMASSGAPAQAAAPMPSTAPPMPTGWKPGDPIPTGTAAAAPAGTPTPTTPTTPAPTASSAYLAAAAAKPWMNPAAGSLSSLAGVGAPTVTPGPTTPVPAIGSMPTYAAPAVIRPPMNLSQLAQMGGY